MKKFPKANLHALTIGVAAIVFFALGWLNGSRTRNDFIPVYDGARCLLHGCNPYGAGVLLYPPSTILALSPMALFHYSAAWFIWFFLNGALFVAAVVVVLSLCPRRHKWLATALGAVILAGSSLLLKEAQPATFAISLVVIGAYFFLRGRALLLGAVLLMLSLAVKPQIGGLVVLYLFFRGVHRRYAAVAMVGAVTFLLCGGLILRMQPQSANWVSDLGSNLSRAVAPGATDDPRPANELAIAAVNLQTITSVFFKDEKAYNDAAYAVFAVLFIAWSVAVLRMNPNMDNHLLSLGALSVLTLMPVYHRSYDSRLLILAIPAALIVFEKRRILGAFLCVLLALSSVSIQHFVQVHLQRNGLFQTVQRSKPLLILLVRESDIILLVLAVLFTAALVGFRTPLDSGQGQIAWKSAKLREIPIEAVGDRISH
ncbi:MAG: glycosyltransferase family 87 protein [Terracidiphilus sp.]